MVYKVLKVHPLLPKTPKPHKFEKRIIIYNNNNIFHIHTKEFKCLT
jgi:hypothetical protein